MKLNFVSIMLLFTMASCTGDDVSLESENLMIHKSKRYIIKIYEGSGEDETMTKKTDTQKVSDSLETTKPNPTSITTICKGFTCTNAIQAKGDGMSLRSGVSTTLLISWILSMTLWL